jgi:predicted acyltransferase
VSVAPHENRPARLACLDALRGFDMVWIVGGREIVDAWATATGSPALETFAGQLRHAEWNGFTAWDLVFPLFLFIAGVAMPFSLSRRVEAGHDRTALARHVVRRGLVLVLLGMLYNIRGDSLESHRFASVLGRIGLGYLGAGLIVLRWQVRGQIAWVIGILLGYWAALSWIPVPGSGAGDLSPGHNFTDWIDQHALPGRLHRGDRDPEGLFSAVPAVATALLGALSGAWIRDRPRTARVSLCLALAGAVLLALGGLWSEVFPINKNLWTSSFVLWTAGWSLLGLALFHQLVDVFGLGRWVFPFTVIGTNAIAIYLAEHWLPLGDWLIDWFPATWHGAHLVQLAGLALLIYWLALYGLWRKRWFLRV